MAAAQRVRQGLRALFAFSQPLDLDLAAQHLSPPLLALFQRMKRSEQLHSLNVLRDVLTQGTTPRDLAAAALLHDVGKTRYPLRVWHKTVVVLVRTALPALYRHWGQGDPTHFLQRAFVVSEAHPEWGAEMVTEVGASDAIAWLVRHHAHAFARWKDHPYAPMLRRLQQADNAN